MKLEDFLNDRYKVLYYLKQCESLQNENYVIKTSQDVISEQLGISKHKVNDIINELVEIGALDTLNSRGKYSITEEGNLVINHIKRSPIKNSEYRCASLFAGIGGIELGFKQAGFKTVYANEFDKNCAKTYDLNFNIPIDQRDIRDVKPEDLPDFDILLAGFPCQAFSIAGYRQGFDDEKGRGELFFEVLRIAIAKQPKVIFLENVKNLTTHDKGNTFKVIKEALEYEGYHLKAKVLNTMEYGNLPQNRERIYIVAFKDQELCEQFDFPQKIELTTHLEDVIDYHTKLDNRFYYTEESFSHYDVLKESIKKRDTLYQWRRVYVRENKSNVCPTLTANMGTGGHNVPLVLTDNGIRKLTPRECFRLQGFPDSYKLPKTNALGPLYKQAGNSVSVTVIKRIADQIRLLLDNNEAND